MESFLQKIARVIEEHELIRPGDRVLVGLSGGPDSVALFHALNYLASQLGITIAAAHVDHGLRKSAAGDRRFCDELCKIYGTRFYSKSVKIGILAKKRKVGIEECGRIVRYEYFERICGKYNYNKIATGHTADDRTETFLMNLIRGANLGGLSGIMIRRGNIIRPLLECGKSEILRFLNQNGLSYRVDESNLKLNFRRNLIRHTIIPQLVKINPGAMGHIAAAAEVIGQNYLFTQKIVDEVFNQCLIEQRPKQIILDLERLSGYYKNLGSWILLKAFLNLSGEHYRPGSESIKRALNLNRNGALIRLSSEIFAARHADRLVLYKQSRKFSPKELKIDDLTVLGDSGAAIVSETIGKAIYSEVINNRDECLAFVDFARVGKLEIRNLKAGDKFNPLGMSGTKKLTDFLNDKKVPRAAKAAVPLVVSGDKIVWVAGFGIADDVKVTKNTKKILKLRLLKNE